MTTTSVVYKTDAERTDEIIFDRVNLRKGVDSLNARPAGGSMKHLISTNRNTLG